jgi:TRAP-type C4-dicarboxylate transport system permease small subunit
MPAADHDPPNDNGSPDRASADHATPPRNAAGRALDALAAAALTVGCLALAGMAAVQGWQVVARYVLNDSPGWTEPVAVLLLNTVMMLGAAIGVRLASHFRFGVLVQMLSARAQRAIFATTQLLIAGVGVLLAGWGAVLAADGWDVAMAGTALPQGAMLLPVCIGGALIALFGIEHAVLGPPPAPVGQED